MTSDPAAATPATGRYRLDPTTSVIRYSGKHLFGTGTVRATFALEEGELRVADPVVDSAVSLTVDAASFSSDMARRDRDVRGAGLLDVDNHPHITFRSHRLDPSSDGWTVTGTVTVRGHDVPVAVEVDRIAPEGSGWRCHGRVDHLDRIAFGITGSRGLVGRYLDLEVDVLAVPG